MLLLKHKYAKCPYHHHLCILHKQESAQLVSAPSDMVTTLKLGPSLTSEIQQYILQQHILLHSDTKQETLMSDCFV